MVKASSLLSFYTQIVCSMIEFEKKIICTFTLWLIWPCPSIGTPILPGGHEIYNLIDPSRSSLVCLSFAQEQRIRFSFKEIHQLYTVNPRIKSPWGWGGVMKFKILWLLSLQMLYTKFGKDWLSRSWEDVSLEQINLGLWPRSTNAWPGRYFIKSQ